jgi:2-polyprenyl-3-methyl-5-hydroxy-6-metoxy-1,4-benzoquinol methylase
MCPVCQVVTLKKEFWATEEQGDYYNNAQNYNSAPTDQEYIKIGSNRAKYLHTIVSKYINLSPEKKWLDIGANYGLLVQYLIKKNLCVWGIEVNHNLVISARQRNLPITNHTVEQFLDKHNVELDIVSAIDVLEHIPEPDTFLNSVNQLLLVDGLLVLEVPNLKSFMAQSHGAQWKYVDREHIHYFTEESLKRILSIFGFDIIYIATSNPFLESFSIKKLLQYFSPSIQPGDRLSRPLKSKLPRYREDSNHQKKSILRLLLRKVLIYFIRVLKREDFLLIIARKHG